MRPLSGWLIPGLIAAFLITGCASVERPAGLVEPLRSSAPQEITTDYTEALRCIGRHVRSQPYPAPRLAIGLITDMTGAQDYIQGRRLTQGATLMAITAAADAGMRLVERYDMGVIQVELDFARNGLLRDSADVVREVQAGSIEGADLYIIGGITEYNPNIRSRGAEMFGSGNSARATSLTLGGSDYVVDVGLDLRLIDARSSEVLAVRSLRKQIVGREIRAGVFGFIDGTMIDIGAGQRALEPVQTAVRTMVDRIVYEFVASLYAVSPDFCLGSRDLADVMTQAPIARGSDIAQASLKSAANARTSDILLNAALPPVPKTQTTPPPAEMPREPASTGMGIPVSPQFRLQETNLTGPSVLGLLRRRDPSGS